MKQLYIVATPIGNLEDITYRAVRILHDVDIILAEDTRVTKKLLQHYDIDTRVISYNEHSGPEKVVSIIDDLEKGITMALVSDAGTPGVADPGSRLIDEIYSYHPDIQVTPLPGASAVTTLISVAGCIGNSFSFLGFVPHKKGRQTFFENLVDIEQPVVFFESPHRIMKTLDSLDTYLDDNWHIVVGRELTKMHEEIVRGNPSEVHQYYNTHPEFQRGEFALVVAPRKKS